MLGNLEKRSIVILLCLSIVFQLGHSEYPTCGGVGDCFQCMGRGPSEWCSQCPPGAQEGSNSRGRILKCTWEGDCFPGSSMVSTSTGNVAMETLNIGDSVLTVLSNTEVGFTKVVGFTDRKPDKESSFLSITAVNQVGHTHTVKLTATHNVYVKTKMVNDKEEYAPRFAEDVLIGDVFKTQTDNGTTEATVIHVTLHKEMGVYNPLTETGTMLVDGTLVSCYGSFNDYLAHLSLAPIRWFPWLFADEEKVLVGKLPYVETMKYIARNLIAPVVSLK